MMIFDKYNFDIAYLIHIVLYFCIKHVLHIISFKLLIIRRLIY